MSEILYMRISTHKREREMGGKERESCVTKLLLNTFSSCVTKLLLNTFSFPLGKGGNAGFK